MIYTPSTCCSAPYSPSPPVRSCTLHPCTPHKDLYASMPLRPRVRPCTLPRTLPYSLCTPSCTPRTLPYATPYTPYNPYGAPVRPPYGPRTAPVRPPYGPIRPPYAYAPSRVHPRTPRTPPYTPYTLYTLDPVHPISRMSWTWLPALCSLPLSPIYTHRFLALRLYKLTLYL